jgi:multiple sugar transport system ATP-binding protein
MTGTGLAGVTVVRGGTPVLRDVTLQAEDGELLVVLGSSGSGKSTALRAIGGLDAVASGDVFIKGRRVNDVPSGSRRAAMVFEASALIPFLDVSRNLGWGLRVQRVPEGEVQERVGRRARQFGLDRLLARRPSQLSKGESGLVGIGHALVQAPDVFLLDEPLAGLDAAHRTQVRREIVEVVRTLGVTTFYVTHDPAEGLAIADRVALLHEGAVVQAGRPRDLYQRPADLFTAEFVGDPPIGLLPARLIVADGQAGFEVGSRTVPLWGPVPPALRDFVGREVVLGVRPEEVHDAAAGHDPDAVALEGMVTGVEYTGRHHVVTVAVAAPPVDAPGVPGPKPATLRSLFPPRAVIGPGDAVRVSVEAARAHVFDASTGAALWHPDDGTPPDADESPAPG